MILTVKKWTIGALAAMAAIGARAGEPQVTEGFINAPVAEVWRLFTTYEGEQDSGATAGLRIGGEIHSRYESTPRDPAAGTRMPDASTAGAQPPESARAAPGDTVTVVSEILAYEPERMLALRIKQAPASFPYRGAIEGTWSVIYFNPAGENMTQVRIVGLGYRDDPQSQAMRKFFAATNRRMLDRIAKPYWPKCALCEREAQSTATR